MKLSTRSEYGLRAMLNIAADSSGNATSITDIAREEGISVAYLEQILNKLRRQGLIASIRGPKGGYILSKDRNAITVGDIVKTLEGNVYSVKCVATKKGVRACKKSSGCVPKLVWLKLAKTIGDCLDAITLEELCMETKKLGGNSKKRVKI